MFWFLQNISVNTQVWKVEIFFRSVILLTVKAMWLVMNAKTRTTILPISPCEYITHSRVRNCQKKVCVIFIKVLWNMYFKTNKFTELVKQWYLLPAWAAAGMEEAASNKGTSSKAAGKEAMRRSTMFQVSVIYYFTQDWTCLIKTLNSRSTN